MSEKLLLSVALVVGAISILFVTTMVYFSFPMLSFFPTHNSDAKIGMVFLLFHPVTLSVAAILAFINMTLDTMRSNSGYLVASVAVIIVQIAFFERLGGYNSASNYVLWSDLITSGGLILQFTLLGLMARNAIKTIRLF